MAGNVDAVADLLATDAALVGSKITTPQGSYYSGILRGGVWTRPLKRDAPAATVEAFYAGEKGRMIRPSAVVMDLGDILHPQERWIPSAYVQTVPIYIYAPANNDGKEAIARARARIYDVLQDYVFATDAGPRAFVAYNDRTGVRDSEEFPEAVLDVVRYRITSRMRNEV